LFPRIPCVNDHCRSIRCPPGGECRGKGPPPRTGEFRGYCFAYFDSIDNATVAKDALVGLTIGDKVLDVKYSNKSVTEAFAAPVPVME